MTATILVQHPDEANEYYFKEGCFILESLNSEEDPEVSIARARVSPGVATRKHALKGTTERYIILSGEGRLVIDGVEALMHTGSVAVIPAGVSQSIKNIGVEDLVFLAICSPRFTIESYQDLEGLN